MKKSRLFLSLFVIVAGVVIFTFVRELFVKTEQPKVEVTVVEEMLGLIQEHSVYKPEKEELVEGALKGMAQAIKDPYSTYYTETEAKLHEASLAEQKAGIGIELSESNGKFIIVAPMKDSPAEEAGIRPLDEIVQIDDVKLHGQSMQQVLKLLQRDVGDKVQLVLYRSSIDEHLRMSLTVQQMKNKTVSAKTAVVQDVVFGIISIKIFGENTAQEWLQAVKQLEQQNIKGLIVDVRGNPGGYLHSVAGVLSTLQKPGTVLAYMENRDGVLEPLHTEKLSDNEELERTLQKWPLTVLQNEGSASASEVFSGALKDWEKAILIGTTSFGKGTVQQSWNLKNGGQVKLSTSKWLTPTEQWIHKAGIEPDIEVEQHEVFGLEKVQLTDTYNVGDYHSDISFVQRALRALGFTVGEVNGYYGEQLKQSVLQFKEQFDGGDGEQLDETFYGALQQQINKTQSEEQNDLQLQMAIGYLMHQVQNE